MIRLVRVFASAQSDQSLSCALTHFVGFVVSRLKYCYYVFITMMSSGSYVMDSLLSNTKPMKFMVDLKILKAWYVLEVSGEETSVCLHLQVYSRLKIPPFLLARLYEVQGELLQSPRLSATAFPSHCNKVLFPRFPKVHISTATNQKAFIFGP